MEYEIVCEHPKLASWTDSLTGEPCHQCMGCGEQIIVPIGTSTQDEIGMVGLLFGNRWKGKVLALAMERAGALRKTADIEPGKPRTFEYPFD